MIIKRKLIALQYPKTDINVQDISDIKDLIIWIENNKIQHLKHKNNSGLLNKNAADWKTHFKQYVVDLGMPDNENNTLESFVDFTFGYAIQMEYSKKNDDYNKFAVKNLWTSNVPNVVADNPLDNLDFSSPEFLSGIDSLAKLLKISPHPDHRVTLKACSTLIHSKLNPQVVQNYKEHIVKGTPYPFKEADLGFDLKDPKLNEAAKILRLLYINDLRNLQTKANECIVAVQSVTADPKTDTKLGKVGK